MPIEFGSLSSDVLKRLPLKVSHEVRIGDTTVGISVSKIKDTTGITFHVGWPNPTKSFSILADTMGRVDCPVFGTRVSHCTMSPMPQCHGCPLENP